MERCFPRREPATAQRINRVVGDAGSLLEVPLLSLGVGWRAEGGRGNGEKRRVKQFYPGTQKKVAAGPIGAVRAGEIQGVGVLG